MRHKKIGDNAVQVVRLAARQTCAKKWQRFAGTQYEIGYQMGQWWAEYMKKLKHRHATKWLCERYEQWLRQGWRDELLPLLRYAIRRYPEVIDEIEGMAKGASDAKLTTTVPAIFALCIGETDYVWHGCSSLVMRSGGGFLLGHNDEEARRYPLCFAEVGLKTADGVQRFASVSYPFQLLGSSCGFNRKLAFQGNSIGYAGKARLLGSSWSRRVPKTFLSRKMLEMSSIEQVVALFGRDHSTLPNHHYICTSSGAYSLCVRPRQTNWDPSSQVSLRFIASFPDCFTNHFEESARVDRQWQWRKCEMHDSERRRRKMERFLAVHGGESDCAAALLDHFASVYEARTSATVRFDVQPEAISCAATYYGEGSGRVIEVRSIASSAWHDANSITKNSRNAYR